MQELTRQEREALGLAQGQADALLELRAMDLADVVLGCLHAQRHFRLDELAEALREMGRPEPWDNLRLALQQLHRQGLVVLDGRGGYALEERRAA